MNLKIDVKISLPSGARVELSPEQRDSIYSFVERVVMGKTRGGGTLTAPKKAVLGARRWNNEEIALVVDRLAGIDPSDTKARHRIVLDLARHLGRTPASVNTFAWKINHTPAVVSK